MTARARPHPVRRGRGPAAGYGRELFGGTMSSRSVEIIDLTADDDEQMEAASAPSVPSPSQSHRLMNVLSSSRGNLAGESGPLDSAY